MSNIDILSDTITDYKIKVLLVDDQPIIGEAVKRMLASESDIELIYCSDASKAIQTAIEIKPTVILQDLIMPDIDGLTLVKFYRAKQELKEIPLIVLSTKEETTTKAEAFALGANDYIVKQTDKIELIARIRYHSQAYINLLQRNEAYDKLLKSQQELASELEKAANYVVSLLPSEVVTTQIQTKWAFIPSAQLGGDCFGYHWLDKDNFAIYLLDVCGHGVGAALLSVSALNSIRSQSLPNTDFTNPSQVLTALNKSYQMEDHNGLYFTMWYAVLNLPSRKISFASAGHPPAILINSNKKAEMLTSNNFIIGGMPDFDYEFATAEIEGGSSLYVFSDGVYEVFKPDGTLWSIEELSQFLVENITPENAELMGLHKHLQVMGSNEILDDDYSILKVIINF